MPAPIDFTLAVMVWVVEGATARGVVGAMRPLHPVALGLPVPNDLDLPRFPEIPGEPGLWIVTCPGELPIGLPPELDLEESLTLIDPAQIYWHPSDAAWRPADARDLYIIAGKTPPGE